MTDDYLACTKAPPSGLPKELGLGSCTAPRNHDGQCQYAWAHGVATITTGRGLSPHEMMEEIPRLYRATRRSYRIAMFCAVLQVGLFAYTVSGLIWP